MKDELKTPPTLEELRERSEKFKNRNKKRDKTSNAVRKTVKLAEAIPWTT